MNSGGSFTAALRTLSVSYPVPFLCALLLAYALAAFASASLAPPIVALVAAATGGLSFVAAVALIGYAVIKRPELLRSERYQLTTAALTTLGSEDLSTNTRQAVERLVLGYKETKVLGSFMAPPGEE